VDPVVEAAAEVAADSKIRCCCCILLGRSVRRRRANEGPAWSLLEEVEVAGFYTFYFKKS